MGRIRPNNALGLLVPCFVASTALLAERDGNLELVQFRMPSAIFVAVVWVGQGRLRRD